jgi:DNA topoisomerase-1
MKLVVVESPAKAKTINKYLGKDYKVLASYGHIRDLPAKDGSVDPEQDFAMTWEADAKSSVRIRDIAEALKTADTLILATDPDREGEAISWHLLEALKARRVLKDKPVQRVVFNAITKSAVTTAMQNPREVDRELVEAYLARRALDYLVGFNLSPVLWRKLPGARSAGRVQSVALRLICEREREIEVFRAQEYWSVEASLRAPDGSRFTARLHELDGKRIQKLTLTSKALADAALAAVQVGGFKVASVEAKPVRRNPAPPFITSTLQQEASRKLGFSAKRTMQAAQKLYEVGHITYMRTDGVQMAEEAYAMARAAIADQYGPRYLPEKARRYTSKAKNAQEAHEAIRPTDFALRPENLPLREEDERRLYALVWKRAVASQMEAAEFERTTVDLPSRDGRAILRATGQVVLFDGYLRLYTEGRDEPSEDDDDARLPRLATGNACDLAEAKAEQHFTEPPPRFSEATLVKRLEELGIGRPSTYASTLSTLQERQYIRIDKARIFPEDKGRLVTGFLESFFKRYVEYDFTAALEEKLDLISDGKLLWKEFLHEFWRDFTAALAETKDLRVAEVLDALNDQLGPYVFPDRDAEGNPIAHPRTCRSCGTGELSLKIGKLGAFVGCSNYPECRYTRPFSQTAEEAANAMPAEGKLLGADPGSGEPVSLRSGRFGPYVQRGEGEAPRRTSLPKGWDAATLTLEQALKLLSLPREVGRHPEDNAPILANLGRYGPYVQHGKTYANLPGIEDAFEIGLNRAVTLIADKRSGASFKRGGAGSVAPLRELGEHPQAGGPVQVFSGRYGPYVKHAAVNATLPKDTSPEAVTLEQAVALLAARAEAAPAKGKAKPKTTKKAPAKTAKAATAKKPAPKATNAKS